MGISVACAWLSWHQEFRLYAEDELPLLLSDMREASVVTGYNVKAFDWNLIVGTLSRLGWRLTVEQAKEIEEKHYCPLHDIRQSAGPFAKGWKLADVLARLDLAPKKWDGADAPQLFKDGKWAKLHTYVLGDVRSERDLFIHCMKKGHLPDKDMNPVYLPLMRKMMARFPDALVPA